MKQKHLTTITITTTATFLPPRSGFSNLNITLKPFTAWETDKILFFRLYNYYKLYNHCKFIFLDKLK